MLPMRITDKLTREQKRKRALELLDSVGLAERKENHLTQLSGGEAQRVSIAIALANNPALILADEPTGELDTENTFKIIDYFRELNQTYGTSFIVATHDERFAQMTERTYKIRDGRIYGMHRKVIEESSTGGPQLKREHILFVDQYGNVRIPEELREEANIHEHVILRFNKDKGVIEIVPLNE